VKFSTACADRGSIHRAAAFATALLPANSEGSAPFETLFHEVLHTVDDSLFKVLQAAFRASGKRWSSDPTHAFIFNTAGELTHRQFPEHVLFAEAVGKWTRCGKSRRIGSARITDR